MDGNRTWAKDRLLPSLEGHRRGYENAKNIIRLVKKRNIPYVSLWVLSDDNIINRSKEEVSYLFDLLERGMRDIAREAKQEGNKIVVIGNRDLLPAACRESIDYAENLTQHEVGTTAIIALGYGGQDEIIRAVQKILENGIRPETLTKEVFQSFVESAQYPNPDLIVRTGGHQRHSGFLLFQSPYAEYYFSEKNWPEFSEDDLDVVLLSFQNRDRKFGK
ncbi:MAG: isoprenyl transferase [Candidatus Altimarinota bacterium]